MRWYKWYRLQIGPKGKNHQNFLIHLERAISQSLPRSTTSLLSNIKQLVEKEGKFILLLRYMKGNLGPDNTFGTMLI